MRSFPLLHADPDPSQSPSPSALPTPLCSPTSSSEENVKDISPFQSTTSLFKLGIQTPMRYTIRNLSVPRSPNSSAPLALFKDSGSAHTWTPTSTRAYFSSRSQERPYASGSNEKSTSSPSIESYLRWLRSQQEMNSAAQDSTIGSFQSLLQEVSLLIQTKQLAQRNTILSISTVSSTVTSQTNDAKEDEPQCEEDIHDRAEEYPQERETTLEDGKKASLNANPLFNRPRDERIQKFVTDIHLISLPQLEERLNSNFRVGLTLTIVSSLQEQWGLNQLTPDIPPYVPFVFLKELISGFGWILWIAALLCFLAWKPFGDPPDPTNLGLGIIIICVILLSSSFSFYQTRKSLNIITSFASILPTFAQVKRDGVVSQLNASDLVPGDIIHVRMGDKIPADVRLLTCEGLQVNNSALTGESEPVISSVDSTSQNILESANICFYSSLVIQGSATAVVINTGDHTVLGQVSALTQANSSFQTNLQKEINRFVLIICSLAVSTAIICAIGWAAWLRVDYASFMPLSNFLTNVIGLVVAYLPTGLPVSLSLVLTFVAKRMYKQKILVKNLSIVEDFNSVSMILSDKTGTLTLNQLTVSAILWGKESKVSVPITVEENDIQTLTETFNEVLKLGLMCNNVELQCREGDGVVGDAVDVALYQLGLKYKRDIEEIRVEYPRIKTLPFNSKTKLMITIHSHMNTDMEVEETVVVKGAPEIILERCSHYRTDQGGEETMNENMKEIVLQNQERLGGYGCRIIALAKQSISPLPLSEEAKNKLITLSKPHSHSRTSSLSHHPTQEINGFPSFGYTFIGLICMLDPVREGVSAAVDKSQAAGIRVAMVTGDHLSTALAIAQKCHILNESQRIDKINITTNSQGSIEVQVKRGTDTLFSRVVAGANNQDHTAEELEDKKNSLLLKNLSQIFDPVDKQQQSERNDIPGSPHPSSDQKKNFALSQDGDNGNISRFSGCVVSGSDIVWFDDKVWDFVLPHRNLVFARTSPEQKLKIVRECQARGEIVAVTGDGVNDAPALKRADIGIAMFGGAAVAREASDMILLDNNFVSVVKAIETGRLVSDNLKKVTLYLLPAGSWSELLPILANVFLGIPLPLSAFLMVIICMLTDMSPSLALVNETPESDIMKRKPVIREANHLVDWKLLFHAYFCIGMIESLSAFFCFFWYFNSMGFPVSSLVLAFDKYSDGYYGYSQDQLDDMMYTGQSIFFVSLVITQFANLLSTRTRYVSFFSHQPFTGPTKILCYLLP